MEPPTGYSWPTSVENGRINGNTITSDIVNESNTDENGIKRYGVIPKKENKVIYTNLQIEQNNYVRSSDPRRYESSY